MNIPVREGETIEGSRTTRNRPYPVLKCSKQRHGERDVSTSDTRVKLCRPFGDALPVTEMASRPPARPPPRLRGDDEGPSPPRRRQRLSADPPAARVPWLRLFSPPA